MLVSSPDFCSAPSSLLLVDVFLTFGGHALCRCLLAVQTFALHHFHFLLLLVTCVSSAGAGDAVGDGVSVLYRLYLRGFRGGGGSGGRFG